MESMSAMFTHLLPSLGSLGVWGYWIILLVSFIEALVVVGSFVPAAVFVVFAGVLVSKGVYDIGDMMIFASVGAILGDTVSYYLGTHGTHLFKNENRFLKADHIERGKTFFTKYGNKSILIGRFFGPVRSFVPFVAGLTRMNFSKFFFWNVTGGILWAVSHILLGYFFGDSLSIIHKWSLLVTTFVLGTVSIFAVLWVVFKQSDIMVRFWKPFVIFLCGFLVYQLADIIFLGEATPIIDTRVHDWFLSVRDEDLILLFRFLTTLGDSLLILLVAVYISIYLFRKKLHTYIAPFWITLISAGATTFVLKIIIARPRPLDALVSESDFSFPSGHATIVVAFYGFLVFVLMRQAKFVAQKNVFLSLGIIIILLVGLSRLYLGVHYLSDVIAGYLVGTMGLVSGIYLHTRYDVIRMKLKSLFGFHLS
jgi:undecaprenyl-diphosphatase